jgi:ribosomal protein S18 acetylase RimI-like enzyme
VNTTLRDGSRANFPTLAKIDGSAPNDWVLTIERSGGAGEHDVSFRWERAKPEGSVRDSNIDEEELAKEWKRSEKLIIAESDGQIAGYAMLGTNWNATAEIAMIIVDRAYRRRGIGGRFVDAAGAFARERGLRAVQWEVQNDNRTAIEFALTHGFRIAGFHDALYRNDDLERQREADFRGIAIYLTKAIEP